MSDTTHLGVNLHRHVSEVLIETSIVWADLLHLQTLGYNRLVYQLCFTYS